MDEDSSRPVSAADITQNLLSTLRALLAVRGHAEVYQTPEGEYRMTGADCRTGSPANRYVVAKPQLTEIMYALDVPYAAFLYDQAAAERVATAVIEAGRRREAARSERQS